MTVAGHTDAVKIEGSASAVIRVPHPWYLHGPNTVADLTVLPLGAPVLPPGRPNLVAIVHERGDNPGVSITNAAEIVVAHVRALVGRPCYVVEHYDDASYNGRRLGGETFDLVTVNAQGMPTWRHLGADVGEVVGELVIEAMRP